MSSTLGIQKAQSRKTLGPEIGGISAFESPKQYKKLHFVIVANL